MTEREAFEAWAGKGLHLEQIPTGAPFAGDYRSIFTQIRWYAWQAACAWQRERDARLCEQLGRATNGIYERNQECADKIRSGL